MRRFGIREEDAMSLTSLRNLGTIVLLALVLTCLGATSVAATTITTSMRSFPDVLVGSLFINQISIFAECDTINPDTPCSLPTVVATTVNGESGLKIPFISPPGFIMDVMFVNLGFDVRDTDGGTITGVTVGVGNLLNGSVDGLDMSNTSISTSLAEPLQLFHASLFARVCECPTSSTQCCDGIVSNATITFATQAGTLPVAGPSGLTGAVLAGLVVLLGYARISKCRGPGSGILSRG